MLGCVLFFVFVFYLFENPGDRFSHDKAYSMNFLSKTYQCMNMYQYHLHPGFRHTGVGGS